jgi:hypothetical protein
MRDAGFVGGTQAGGHLRRQIEQPLDRQRPALDLVAKVLAFDELGDDEGDVLLDADVVDGKDVRMIESAGSPGFLEEALPPRRIAGDLVAQDLEFDLAVEARVPRAEHLTHTARIERANDFVAADPLTGVVWHGRKPI